ncbi:hypothetical protein G1ANC_00360 [Candidatus Nanosynsacchari sp. TM7_ANC_38.39_G1_1]|nr:hypothetical protein G1ANC_00360 [Candidatus Nanosynsacchari sp. TM7_ANC_38.39_G1_1]
MGAVHVLFDVDDDRQRYGIIVRDLVTDGFGHWSVKGDGARRGVAKITVGAVNCSGDEFVDFGIAGDWVFN